jgi:quercetin dioxygenase-like cupin family protein
MTMTATPPTASPTAAAPSPAVIRTHREARVLWVLGTRQRFLVDGADTGGRFALIETYAPACHAGPPPHMHEDAEETFHILDGAVKVMVAGQTTIARAGDTLIVPRGVLHTFSNPFLTACRFLVQLSPAGFERFFTEIGVPPVSPIDLMTPPQVSPPSPEQLRAAAIKFHLRVPGLTD